jgi:hypothetical protein
MDGLHVTLDSSDFSFPPSHHLFSPARPAIQEQEWVPRTWCERVQVGYLQEQDIGCK